MLPLTVKKDWIPDHAPQRLVMAPPCWRGMTDFLDYPVKPDNDKIFHPDGKATESCPGP